jgi:phage shock protein PspC (stress-responsive transcriptional regulator)/DNA-binding XRE family transcriptional regulator
MQKNKEDAMDTIPFGKKIAELRRQKGFSQDGLAYLCKIDVRTVQRIETGRVEPRPSTLRLMSEVLGPVPVPNRGNAGHAHIRGLRVTLLRFAAAFRSRKGETVMKKQSVLQRLARSRKDRKIAGICGGLGEHSGLPSWFWRLAFIAGAFVHGAGALAYLFIWIFMPQEKGAAARGGSKTATWLQRLTRSAADKRLGGVCGGLGAVTAVPSWIWRMGFVAAVFFYGAGLILYAFLWMSVPKSGLEPAHAGQSAAARR